MMEAIFGLPAAISRWLPGIETAAVMHPMNQMSMYASSCRRVSPLAPIMP